MDRVLLIIDDIQYSRHVEMTLRKVGFDVEALSNEFNLAETILTFNPDYVICRGNTNRLSVHSVGRKLKEASTKFFGKVFLIFPEGYKITPEDVTKLRMDMMLFDPLSTLKLAMHLFAFSQQDFETVRDKLLKFAITDTVFRNYEQGILKGVGKTLDSEIQIISSMQNLSVNFDPEVLEVTGADEAKESDDLHFAAEQLLANEPQNEKISETISETITGTEQESDYTPSSVPSFPDTDSLSEEIIIRINMEIQAIESELPLRIDTYNHVLKDVEQDIKVGLLKRQTRSESKKLHGDLMNEQKTDEIKEKTHHDEKIRFADALFRKKS